MNYVVTRNEVTCTKINHIQLFVQVAKCRIESGAKHRRRPQFRLLAKYIHKTLRTDTDRASFDWLIFMIKY